MMVEKDETQKEPDDELEIQGNMDYADYNYQYSMTLISKGAENVLGKDFKNPPPH